MSIIIFKYTAFVSGLVEIVLLDLKIQYYAISHHLHEKKIHLNPWKLETVMFFSAPALPSLVSKTRTKVLSLKMWQHTPYISTNLSRKRSDMTGTIQFLHLWRENKTLWPLLWSGTSNKIWLLNIKGTTDGKIMRLIFLPGIASKIVTLSWHLVTDKKN